MTAGKLAIRVRRVMAAETGETIHATVHCPCHARSVSLDDCADCTECGGFDFNTLPASSWVTCRGSPQAERPPPPGDAHHTMISSVMTRDVTCVREDLPAEALPALLLDNGISGAPVVDAAGRPVGVVSKTDLLIERGTVGATARDLMTPLVFSLPEDTPLSQAAALMAYEGVHRIPVVAADGSVVGVVSTLDVTRWVARQDGAYL